MVRCIPVSRSASQDPRFFLKPVQFHLQLSDLLIELRLFLLHSVVVVNATTGENLCSFCNQLLFPICDLIRMNAVAGEQGSTHIKAFNVDKIYNLRSTNQPFSPRYRIEFSHGGPLQVGDTASRARISYSRPSSRRSSSLASSGPKYVFECSYCGKRFRRSTHDSQLRPHKTKDGWDCPGRTGYYVDTIW